MGVPLWYSGPHLGTFADIRIARNYPPPLLPDQKLLGDKGYVGHGRIIPPYKKTKNSGGLTKEQRDFNLGHGWYRSTVEHFFGLYACVHRSRCLRRVRTNRY